MKKFTRVLAILLALVLAFPAACAQELGNSIYSMIHYSPDNGDRHFIGSPSLVIASDGAYYACHNYFGNQTGRTYVYKSEDRGSTWTPLNQDNPIVGMFWATIFEANDFDENGQPNGEKALYIMGTKGEINGFNAAGYDEIAIAKVTDGGETITQPVFFGDALGHKTFHSGDTPVLRVNGRIYKTFEYVEPGGWGANFRTGMLAIDEELDPMVPGNWRITPKLSDNNRLEGIPVLAPDGQIYSFMRNAGGNSAQGHSHTGVQVYKLDPAVDPYTDPEDFVMYEDEAGYKIDHMPGVRYSKFFILRDEVSNRYLWFVNRASFSEGTERNVLDMYESKDLVDWNYVMNIVEDDQGLSAADSINKTAFSQMTAVIDGEDLVLVSRTAYDKPDSYHNANFLSFHRVPLFRQRLDADREVGFYPFDDPAKPGRDASKSADKDANLPDGLLASNGKYGSAIAPAEGLYGDLGPRVNTAAAHEYFDGTSRFSLAAWVKPDTLKARSTVFANYASGDKPGFEVYLDEEGHVHLLASCTGANVGEAVFEARLPAGEWSHIAVSVDYMTGEASLYVDGELIETEQLALEGEYAPNGSAAYARLGSGMEPDSWFGGLIDEVHLYRAVIDADRAAYLYDYTQDPAALEDLTVNGETIPGFNPYVKTYELPTSAAKADVRAVPLEGSPAEVEGVTVPKEDGSPYVLDYGVASLEVRGETYHVNLRRKSADATLEKLTLLGGLFPPALQAETFTYTIKGLAVPKDYVPETIIDRAMAKSCVHGARVELGPVTGDFSQEPYVLTQTVLVTAEDGTENTYTFRFLADQPIVDDGARLTAPEHLTAAWDFQGETDALRLADKAPAQANNAVKDTLTLRGIEGRFQFQDGTATILPASELGGDTKAGSCLVAANSADLSQDGPMTIWVRFKMTKPGPTDWPVLVDKRVFGGNSQRPYGLVALRNTDGDGDFGLRVELARKGAPATAIDFDTSDNAGLGYDQWQEVAVVVDRKSITNDLNITVYGAKSESKAAAEDFKVLLHQEMGFAELCQADTPLRLGGYIDSLNSHEITLDGVRIYNRDLSVEELAAISPDDLKVSPSDATLAELYLNGSRLDGFAGQEDFSTTVYQLNTDGQPELKLTAVPTNPTAKVEVNDEKPLVQTVTVTSADGKATKTYTVRVTLERYALTDLWQDQTGDSASPVSVTYDKSKVKIEPRKEGQYAFVLDGSNPARLSKDFATHMDGAEVLTVSAWMRPDRAPEKAEGFLFGACNSGNIASIDLALKQDMKGILVGGRSAEGEGYRGGVIPYAAGFQAGSWYHVLAEYDFADKTVSLYVNSSLAGTQKAEFASNTYTGGTPASDFGLGCDAKGTRLFYGGLGQVQVFDKKLTAEEILTLSEREPAPPPSDDPLDHLVAAWNFTGADETERLADKAPAGSDKDDLTKIGPADKFKFDETAGTVTIDPGAVTCLQAPGSGDLAPTGPMTIYARFQLSGSGDWPVIVDNRDFDAKIRPYALLANGADGKEFGLSGQLASPEKPNNSTLFSGTVNLACDQWQTVALVVSRPEPEGNLRLSIYAKDEVGGFTPVLADKDMGFAALCDGSSAALRLGGYNKGTANTTTITFDEVRIYDQALTVADLAAVSDADLAPEVPEVPEEDPITIWEDRTGGKDPYVVTADEGIATLWRDKNQPAFHFDGTQAVKVGVGFRNNISLAETISVALWMKPDTIPESGGTLQFLFGGYNQSGGNDASIDVAFKNQNTMHIGGRCKQGGAYKGGEIAYEAGFQAGQWYHIIAQYNYKDDNIKLYVDGQLVGAYTDVGFERDDYVSTWSTKAPFTIGTNPAGKSGFTGGIGQVKVYNRALTAQEIADLSETELPLAELLAEPALPEPEPLPEEEQPADGTVQPPEDPALPPEPDPPVEAEAEPKDDQEVPETLPAEGAETDLEEE